MNNEHDQTYKIFKEKHPVPQEAKEQLKQYTRTKKAILEVLKEESMTVEQITEKLTIPRHETLYYLMSLIKYGLVKVDAIDDMDEYFTYKLVK
jgi:predicted ArsR family transcriptional regulator